MLLAPEIEFWPIVGRGRLDLSRILRAAPDHAILAIGTRHKSKGVECLKSMHYRSKFDISG
jgi:hypothetical protein